MAKQVKEKKTTTKSKKEEIVSTLNVENTIEQEIVEKENTTEVQDVSELTPNIDDIEKSLNEVNTEIKIESVENELEKTAEKTIEDLKETTSKIEEFEASKADFNKKIQEQPEKAQEIIKEEIKRVEKMKSETEKIINSTKKKPIIGVTSWWNGMGYNI